MGHGGNIPIERTIFREPRPGAILLTQPPADVAWWRLGQVLEKQDCIEPAREAYRKAVALDMRDRDYATSLRQLYAQAALR